MRVLVGTLRSMLFMSDLIKRFKANELNGSSQATELQHHCVQDGLGLQICSQVALWWGSSTVDTQELWFYWLLVWIGVWWVWQSRTVYEIWDHINLFFYPKVSVLVPLNLTRIPPRQEGKTNKRHPHPDGDKSGQRMLKDPKQTESCRITLHTAEKIMRITK